VAATAAPLPRRPARCILLILMFRESATMFFHTRAGIGPTIR
jgi:hypothetical protein